MAIARPLIVSGPDLLGWLALVYAGARLEGMAPPDTGAGEAAGVVESQLSNGHEGGHGWPSTS